MLILENLSEASSYHSNGIGTGLAKLPPNFLEYLNKKLLEVGIINGK